MSEYQLQMKQIVDHPRCRIYRQFIQSLINDRNIRTVGGSGLFYYTVLCSYASFNTLCRHIDGISYTVYPGEWICTLKELSGWFRTRFQYQALDILEKLQKQHLISYLSLDRGKVIKYKVRNWNKHNTVLNYDCPCQKDTGFFFLPSTIAAELISVGCCSEMDIILDLWFSAVYNDIQVQGSDIGPVVYLRNGSGCPHVSYSELAARWGISTIMVERILKKFVEMDYLFLKTFPGRTGCMIYLNNYLATMFQISDVLLDKEEVAMVLNINILLPEESADGEIVPAVEEEIYVSEDFACISKSHMACILQKMAKVLETQGISCFHCPKSRYQLFPLSDNCRGVYSHAIREGLNCRFGLAVLCGEKQVSRFALTLLLADETEGRSRLWERNKMKWI